MTGKETTKLGVQIFTRSSVGQNGLYFRNRQPTSFYTLSTYESKCSYHQVGSLFPVNSTRSPCWTKKSGESMWERLAGISANRSASKPAAGDIPGLCSDILPGSIPVHRLLPRFSVLWSICGEIIYAGITPNSISSMPDLLLESPHSIMRHTYRQHGPIPLRSRGKSQH